MKINEIYFQHWVFLFSQWQRRGTFSHFLVHQIILLLSIRYPENSIYLNFVQVNPDCLLAHLYLLDSICKNHGHPFTDLFQANLVPNFIYVFSKANEKVYLELFIFDWLSSLVFFCCWDTKEVCYFNVYNPIYLSPCQLCLDDLTIYTNIDDDYPC